MLSGPSSLAARRITRRDYAPEARPRDFAIHVALPIERAVPSSDREAVRAFDRRANQVCPT